MRSFIYYTISLLIAFIWCFFILNALSSFYNYKTIVASDLELTREHFHFFLRNELRKEWAKIIAPPPLRDNESPLRTFHISVDSSDLDSLNANLPISGKDHYVDAYMLTSDDQKVRKIKLRYRGDNFYHWAYAKKSLRIKLGKGDPYNMDQKFNLINPPLLSVFRDYVYYKIARQAGLLSPEFFPVRVFVNGKFMGVYTYISQVDESLLRKNKVMPGSIYYGDGYSSQLWFDSQRWRKKSSRNKEQKKDRSDIKMFINEVNASSDKDFFSFINKYVDKQKLFSFIALDRLYGSHHHDMTHNHKIYFDPYKGKFEPIAWDLRVWAERSKDLSLYPLSIRLKANPVYDAEIDKILYSMLENGIVDKTLKIYAEIISLSERDMRSDVFKDTATWLPELFQNPPLYKTPYSIRELYEKYETDNVLLRKRDNYLFQMMKDVSVSVFVNKGANRNVAYLKIDGNSPVAISFKSSDKRRACSISLKDKTITGRPIILYPGRKWALGRLEYDPDNVAKNQILNVPLIYSLKSHEMGVEEILNSLKVTNAITGETVIWKRETFDPTSSDSDIDPYDFMSDVPKEKILSGEVAVSGNLVFPATESVTVLPGTVFRMEPEASIFFYGKVTAEGTKEKPIRFVAANNEKPWGVVAVQGKAASNSKFEYCEFENGSAVTHNLIHYTAPINIHDVDWFEMRNCRIKRNYIGDDSAHIAYAKGVIDNCIFENARSDGLDMDISEVNVTNSVFVNSGNDGLDIMTTHSRIENNLFINTGDKGASIGEWSEVALKNNIFINNEIGLEVKDKSRVTANNLLFVDARKRAINLYNKNKRYDEGGFLSGEKIYLLGNTKVKADQKSELNINYFSSLPEDERRIFDGLVRKEQYQPLVRKSISAHVQ